MRRPVASTTTSGREPNVSSSQSMPPRVAIARASSSGYRSPPPNNPRSPNAVGATWRTRMLIVSLVTLGSPDQLTGGYLYHRRMADDAAAHDARIDFVSARMSRDPFAGD